LQERGKRYDPLIFPANFPKDSRNGIGCIQRNPTKGIERVVSWVISASCAIWLVAFKEIPQRELRGVSDFSMISCICEVAFKEIPQRELRVAYAFLDVLWGILLEGNFSCIQRNPTKGIESV